MLADRPSIYIDYLEPHTSSPINRPEAITFIYVFQVCFNLFKVYFIFFNQLFVRIVTNKNLYHPAKKISPLRAMAPLRVAGLRPQVPHS